MARPYLVSYKAWRVAHPEKIKQYNRRAKWKREFGLTEEQYWELFAKQDGACALCRKKQAHKLLAVDHHHETKRNRGLLCDSCNRGIGLLQDNPGLLRAAAEYLEKT